MMSLEDNKNNQIDLQINSLLDFSIEDLTEDIVPQSDLIDSKVKNITGESFYKSINDLYQRIRTLESINKYIKNHLIKELDSKTNQINTVINEIEALQQEDKKISYENDLSLISYTDSFIDKDGVEIEASKLNNGRLVMNYQSIISAFLDSTTINRRTISPYKSTPVSMLLKNKPYRSMYVLKDYQENGIVESLIFKLKEPVIVNYIDIGLHNCYIDSITLTDENNNKKTYKGKDLYNINKNKLKIQEVEITLITKNFKQVKRNKQKLDKDFYNSINRINKNYEDHYNKVYSKDSLYLHENSPEIIHVKEKLDPELSLEYILGIDYINVEYIQTSDRSVYLSNPLKLRKDTQFIDLEISDSLGDGTIEYFYLINNEKKYIPNQIDRNINEYFFFKINNTPTGQIFINGKEGTISDIQNGDIITYITNDKSKLKTNPNDLIQVGAILRKGDISDPFINNIKLIQYIGDKDE